jgi:hypothetical protein
MELGAAGEAAGPAQRVTAQLLPTPCQPPPQPCPRQPHPTTTTTTTRSWKDQQSGALSEAAAALAAFDAAHPPGGKLGGAQRLARGELEARLGYLKELDKGFEDFGGRACLAWRACLA